MVNFKKFFSKQEQRKRFTNVRNVLKIAANPFRKGRIVANVKSKPIRTALETVANNPFTTAAVIATGGTAAGRTVVKNIGKNIGKKFAAAKFSTQAKIVGGSLVAGGILKSSSKARKAISKPTQLPKNLANFGSNIGKAIDNPTAGNIANIVKDNPILSTATAAAVLAPVAPLAGTAAIVASNRIRNKNKPATPATIVPPAAKGLPKPVAVPANPVTESGITNPIANTEPTQSASTRSTPKTTGSPRISQKTEVNI